MTNEVPGLACFEPHPAVAAVQEFKRQLMEDKHTKPVKPMMQDPEDPMPKVVPELTLPTTPVRQPARSYPAVLTYAAPDDSQPGLILHFKVYEVDLTDPHYITLYHGSDIRISLTRPTDRLTLRIGDTDHPVSWIGASFRFPGGDFYGITFMRRDVKKP